jgi:hypothetical protein
MERYEHPLPALWEHRADIIRSYTRGRKLWLIAKEFHVPESAIGDVLRYAGVPTREQKRSPFSKKKRDALIERYLAGETVTQLARTTRGTSYTTIRRMLIREGVYTARNGGLAYTWSDQKIVTSHS